MPITLILSAETGFVVNVYVISNANKDLTSKVADELEVNYVYSAKKPNAMYIFAFSYEYTTVYRITKSTE